MNDPFKREVHYEWVAETRDVHEDIIDPLFGETFYDVHMMGLRFEHPDCHDVVYALVRNAGTEADGLEERGYAYLDETNHLPEYFDCGHKVPKKFARCGLHRRIYTTNPTEGK